MDRPKAGLAVGPLVRDRIRPEELNRDSFIWSRKYADVRVHVEVCPFRKIRPVGLAANPVKLLILSLARGVSGCLRNGDTAQGSNPGHGSGPEAVKPYGRFRGNLNERPSKLA